MPESKAIQRLDAQLSQVPPGTLRYEALETAKRFKGSWIDLGRVLWSVYKDKAFREWGYLTFDAYCLKELGLRAATAKKLLHSYSFLEREEPVVLKRVREDPAARLPHYEAVNALRLLSRKASVPASGYQQVRAQVLDHGKEAPEIRRGIKMMLEESDAAPEEVRAARRQASIRRMLGTLKAIRLELEAGRMVPAKLLTDIDVLARKLEAAL